jgi:hypothetical protein
MAQQWDGSNWSAGQWDANNWRGPNEADTGIRYMVAGLTGSGDLAATVTADGVEAEQPSGGFYFEALRVAQQRQRRRKRELEEAAAEQAIADAVSREIARLMHEAETAEAKLAESTRLVALAKQYAEDIAENERIERALRDALAKQSEGAWLALQREIERAAEEEELAVAMALLLLD